MNIACAQLLSQHGTNQVCIYIRNYYIRSYVTMHVYMYQY